MELVSSIYKITDTKYKLYAAYRLPLITDSWEASSRKLKAKNS